MATRFPIASLALLILFSSAIHQGLFAQPQSAVYDSVYVQQLLDKGTAFAQKTELDSAIDVYGRCLKYQERFLSPDDIRLQHAWFGLGENWTSMGRYRDASKCMEEVLRLKYLAGLGQTMEVEWIYYRLSLALLDNGDYDQVIANCSRGIEEWGKDYIGVVGLNNLMGIAYHRKEDFESALRHFKLVRFEASMGQFKNPGDLQLNNIFIGIVLRDQGKYQEALEYLLETHATMEENPDWWPWFRYLVYDALGELYMKTGQYDKAEPLKRKAIEIRSDTLHHPPFKKGPDFDLLRTTALMYEAKGNDSAALGYVRQIINFLCFGKWHDETEISFPLPVAGKARHKLELLKALDLQGKLLRKTDPDEALQSSVLAIQLLDSVQMDLEASQSKQSLKTVSHALYETGIETAWVHWEATEDPKWIEQIAYFMEKARSTELLQGLRTSLAEQFAGVPDSIIEKAHALKARLNWLEKEAHAAFLQRDSLRFQQFQARLSAVRRQHKAMVERMESDYPAYFELKYPGEVADLWQVQQMLDQRSAFVQYFWGEDYIYILLIDPSQVAIRRRQIDEALNARISTIRKAHTEKGFADTSLESIAEYRRAAHGLFVALLQDEVKQLPASVDRLVLVPDGDLHNLSLETLVTTPSAARSPSFATMDYLIRDYSVQYTWSGTYFAGKSLAANPAHNGLALAFAPTFGPGGATPDTHSTLRSFRDGAYAQLPGAAQEVHALASLFKGEVFVGNTATESNFRSHASQSALIHLATHGVSDNENPLNSRLVFAQLGDSSDDGSLHAYEIYNYSFSADLAVLSACATGAGKIAKGEGIMSLARAFSYAGCPAVVSSLWKADDNATATIMEAFYGGLANGLPKDEALRQAKLSYLDGKDIIGGHPYLWAGFVSIGDRSLVEMGATEPAMGALWAVLGVCALGLVLLVVRWRKRAAYRS